MNKCLFIDRDGTINVFNSGYNFKKEHITLIPGVDDLIARFCKDGYKIIVITNQGGIGQGLYTEEDFNTVNEYIATLLKPKGGQIDAVFFCPHNQKDGLGEYKVACSCRKPGPLLLERAIKQFDADVAASLFIGDNITDKQCAQNAGVRFYPFEFRDVITTSQGFRITVDKYDQALIEDIVAFAKKGC